MRISDWSSDVCSSDISTLALPQGSVRLAGRLGDRTALQSRFEDFDLAIINTFVPGLGIDGRATGSIDFSQSGSGFPSADARVRIANFTRSSLTTVSEPVDIQLLGTLAPAGRAEIGRASCRERGCQEGEVSGVDGSLKKNKQHIKTKH